MGGVWGVGPDRAAEEGSGREGGDVSVGREGPSLQVQLVRRCWRGRTRLTIRTRRGQPGLTGRAITQGKRAGETS